MSDRAEIIRKGLERARAEERFERSEYEKRLDETKFDEDSGKWVSSRDRLEAIGSGLDSAKPHFRKPRVLGRISLDPSPSPLAKITLDESESVEISDILQLSGRGRFDTAWTAHKGWLERLDAETGKVGDPENLLAKEQGRDELRRITNEIALTLESEGEKAWRRTGQKIFRYYPNSGTVATAPQFRRLCFLPLVAAMKRRKYVDAMDSYLAENRWCRMYVLTSGERVTNTPCIATDPENDVFEQVHNGEYRIRKRTTPKRFQKRCSFVETVPVMENGQKLASGIKQSTTLRERIRSFNREVSRFASDLRKAWGVEVLMRATELGTPENCPKHGHKSDIFHLDGLPDGEPGLLTRNANNETEFHVHAHLLVNQHRKLSKEDFEKLLKWINKRWPYYWHEAGLLVKSREVCKYITKPAAIERLRPSEIIALFRATERLKLIHPMGQIAADMKRRRDDLLRLESFEDFSGQMKWREVPDINRLTWAQRPREPGPGEAPSPAWVEYCRKRRLSQDSKEERPTANEDTLRVVARCQPSFAPGSCVKEPSVVVLGPVWDKEAVDRHPAVLAMLAASRDAWQDGLKQAEDIRVHVDRPTVGDFPPWVLEGSDFCREEHFDDPPPTTETFDFYQCQPV